MIESVPPPPLIGAGEGAVSPALLGPTRRVTPPVTRLTGVALVVAETLVGGVGLETLVGGVGLETRTTRMGCPLGVVVNYLRINRTVRCQQLTGHHQASAVGSGVSGLRDLFVIHRA